jgi:hypothetical protein
MEAVYSQMFCDGADCRFHFKAITRADLPAAISLALTVLLSVCWFYGSWTLQDWQRPWYVGGDVYLMQGVAKAVAEGDVVPFLPTTVERLNAPFGASWGEYPLSEKLFFLLGGCGVRVFGATLAYNLGILGAHILAAASFYLSARWLGSVRSWAWLGAVAFASSRYLFMRDAAHLNLSFCWHLPLMWVAAYYLWQGRTLTRAGWMAVAGLSFVSAWQHSYYAYFWLLMLFPCCVRYLVARDWARLRPPLLFTAATVVLVAAANLDSMLSWILNGRSPTGWTRNLASLHIAGLRLPDLFCPAEHRVGPLDTFGKYAYHLPIRPLALETDTGYLGVLGVALLGYVLVRNVPRLLTNQPVDFVFGMSLWLVMVSLTGGLNLCAGVLGLQTFRCMSRISIDLLAGLLLAGCLAATRRSSSPLKAQALIVAVLAVLVLLDSTPRRPGQEHFAQMASRQATDVATLRLLESLTDSDDMVLQWPHVPFPESATYGGFDPYEQLGLYIASQHLRFSYGNVRGRPESSWLRQLETAPPEKVLSTAEQYGFRACVLYVQGVPPETRAAWERLDPQRFKRSVVTAERWVYLLQPPAVPAKPPIVPTAEPVTGMIFLSGQTGWFAAERQCQWTFLAPGGPARLKLSLRSRAEPLSVTILVDGAALQTVALDRPGVVVEAEALLPSLARGIHALTFETAERPGDPYKFELGNLHFER